MNQPYISVGIVTSSRISFTLNGDFVTDAGETVTGDFNAATCGDAQISVNRKAYSSICFTPSEEKASFTVHDVTIGISYHWERQEEQTFTGELKIIRDKNNLILINTLPVEDYLKSVISSEMNATSSLEFLKAHAVISRSWLLAQIEKRCKNDLSHNPVMRNEDNDSNTLIRWYDREDHTLFDVCADDHCQRYQGITKASNPYVAQAVNETSGMVLTYDSEICDARFSKCCGGATEIFSTCWENKDYDYLPNIADNEKENALPDLSDEKNAETWIRTSPDSFCNTNDKTVLKQILNNYDQETSDFYRWKVQYSQSELSELIRRKTGIDFGDIKRLNPIKRGKSGRISHLEICGTKRSLIIGKELEIRRSLSESHLFSSAFVVDYEGMKNDIPEKIILTGAGWGHGVGLCQIGAAVMGEKGYSFDKILLHYYRGAEITRKY